MDDSTKVFSPIIVNSKEILKNNLYDLIHIEPARPLQNSDRTKDNSECDYSPKTDKCYIPKRKYHRRKVKTVSDIRKEFEQETYSYLNSYLERQESILLKKISCGSSGEEDTKTLAKNVLKTDEPISRSSWQMLININPDNHMNPKQFVLYDGKYIQVNGSLGGKRKLICNYDLALKKNTIKKKYVRNDHLKKSKGLLRNSLDVKFKPGPLGMKKFLDDSHQKYHVGEIALVDLPKPGLNIQPSYGCALDPSITNFLNNLRKEDGTIAPKWAEFAVSVLGTMENSNAVLMSKDCVTFSLNYKYEQGRILMRRDFNNKYKKIQPSNATKNGYAINENQASGLSEIKNIMNEILDSVEISVKQDDIYNTDEDFVDIANEISSLDERNMRTSAQKDKNKNRYGELGRLDVTVISIPDATEENINQTCKKSFCLLGCICHSLATSYNLKYHCGRVECMFECTCKFANYKTLDSSDTDCSDLMPAIANIDRAINIKLAKEEQKFHQTVILKGHKSILLKSEKRNWKASKKYADFYSTMCLKNESQKMQNLVIVSPKLDCRNIEPLCMVHNLYKCFCKGKYIDTWRPDIIESSVISEAQSLSDDVSKIPACQEHTGSNKKDRNSSSMPTVNYDKGYPIDTKDVSGNKINKTMETRSSNRNLSKVSYAHNKDSRLLLKRQSVSENIDNMEEEYYDGTCSRVNAYKGRKFSNGYYKHTNTKIYEMEKNDKTLQQRLLTSVGYFEALDKCRVNKIFVPVSSKSPINPNETFSTQTIYSDGKSLDSVPETSRAGVNLGDESSDSTIQVETAPNKKKKTLPSESKLVTWLVANYQKFKERVSKGKAVLHPPENGKIALHSWDFILQRYRERKNMFLVTKQKPFRIFLAIDAKDPFFHNCTNITEIRSENLNNYPQTVKNLLTNTTQCNDNFCVLRGLHQCWEFVGLISKIKEENKDVPQTSKTTDRESETISPTKSSDTEEYKVSPKDPNQNAVERSDSAETSKWFVMTVENDFSEIRFYRKGFFVKYESIVKAINVARVSGKTVRLSSTKCMEKSNSPQFGIYAIPNNNEHCVFVGPYEINDTLGIESIKSAFSVGYLLKRTRGFWLKTNKIDNDNVIKNPMSFMITDQNNKVDLLDNLISIQNKSENVSPTKAEPTENLQAFNKSLLNRPDSSKITDIEDKDKHSIITKRVIKPITISKSNTNFHIKIPILPKLNTTPDLDNHDTSEENQTVSITKSLPSPEDATSQIKILDVFSMQKEESQVTSPSRLDAENEDKFVNTDKEDCWSKAEMKPETKGSELGMFILKPEEINRKMLQMKIGRDDTSKTESDSYRIDSILKKSLSDSCDDTVDEDMSDNELSKDIDRFCQKNLNESSVGFSDPNAENFNENDISDMTENCGLNELTNISSESSNSFFDNTKINTINQSLLKKNLVDTNSGSQNSTNQDCFILSDDDDDKEMEENNKKVYLESCIGWVEAYSNDYNLISFKLEGCENSQFYSKYELPEKLNSELYKKIFNVESQDAELCLKWKLVTQKIKLSQRKIDNANLSSYKMKLVKRGLVKSKVAAARIKKKLNAKQLNKDKKTSAQAVRSILRTYSRTSRKITIAPSTITTILSSDDEQFVEEQENMHARLSPNDDSFKVENMATRRTPEPSLPENKDSTPRSPSRYLFEEEYLELSPNNNLLEERMEVEYLQDSPQETESEKTDSSDEDIKELVIEEDNVS